MSRIPSDRIRTDDDPPAVTRSLSAILKSVARDDEPRQVQRPLAGVLKRGTARLDGKSFQLPSNVGEANRRPLKKDLFTSADVALLRVQWETELNAENEAALRAAMADAFDRGRAEARAEFDEARERFDHSSQQFNAMWQGYLDRVQPQIAELAFSLASGILASPLPDDLRSVSVNRLAVAVEQMGAHAPIVVSVHPVELMQLQESGVADQIAQAHAGLRWNGDASLDHGDWEARCPTSVIRHVAREMLDDLRSRLQVPPLANPALDDSSDSNL